jgi:hypothetical protein
MAEGSESEHDDMVWFCKECERDTRYKYNKVCNECGLSKECKERGRELTVLRRICI